MRRELLEVIMRDVFEPKGPSLREIVEMIEKFARENGNDELKIAREVGKVWGRIFKLAEERYDAAHVRR